MASGTPPSSSSAAVSAFDMSALFRAPQNPNPNASPGANPPSFAPYLYQYPPRSLPLSAPATPSPGGGAHLMALLGGSASLESAASLPPSSSLQYTSSGEFAPPTAIASQRSGSVKQPKGRRLPPGDRAVYDVDSRLPDEPQPSQLEVSPITKYTSDPGLVLGQQIAVNRTYICYGLKLGAIRVLNINTALRSLLKGHRQRVTDMAFFAEDVHLLASSSSDGRIFIWKIDEGPDDSEKPQITEKIIIAIQIVTNDQSVHPRVCWHCHKQEILAVGIGNLVLRIDTTKLGKLDHFSAEKPLPCSVEKLIDGVQLIGKHEAEVTDLSMSQWMTTRLVSASKDGTVKIWEDLKAAPLAILRPHDGQPVNSATFVTAPHRPDHIVLITAGPLNRELKIWVSSGGEGWFLAGESVSWHCAQTLELRSSSEIRIEDAFFNQVVVLPQASLILLANAKKNAIYAVHVNYGPNPVSTRMDYVSEFMVTMPILSLTGITECLLDGAQVVQVYCVQTQAIQQYALDLSQCLPPALETTSLENEPYFSSFPEQVILNMPSPVKNSCSNVATEILPGTAFLDSQVSTSAYDLTIWSSAISGVSENYATESGVSNMEYTTYTLGSPSLDANVHISPLTVAISQDASKRFNVPEQAQVDTAASNHYSTGYVEQKDEFHNSDISFADETASSLQGSHLQVESGTPHLITPSEILSGSITSLENTGFMHEQKVGEAIIQSNAGPDFQGDKFENFGAIAYVSGDLVVEKEKPNVEKLASKVVALNKASLLETDFSVDNVSRTGEIGVIDDLVEPLPADSTKDFQVLTDDISEKLVDSATVEVLSTAEVEKQKVKMLVPSGSSSFSASPFNSTNSVNDGDLSGFISMDAMLTTLLTMQENINEILVAQKEMQKQLSATVSIPTSKEGRRIEASLGRSMEKAIKGNVDGLWARYQEESAKHEKMERDRFQQLTSLLTNCMTKELPAMFEKTLRKEMSAIGPAVTRAVTPILEKTISSAVTDCFQKSVGEKVVTQLEKSINTKLETMLGRQLQSQLLSSGKIAFQDSLRSVLESSVVPAFEKSCKSMFEQVDVAFQKGMSEHSAASQKQFDSSHTTLGLTLQDAINSVSSITQNLTNELAEGQRKLLTLLSSGKHLPLNSMSMQRGNDAFGALLLPESVDPKTELTRLVSEHKFEEAFTLALQRSDLSIVSWLCLQVDLQGICSMVPLPLSQGVLLALFQQLACDLGKDTSQKLGWMTEVATVINPTDLTVASHVRPIFEQISQILIHQRALPTTSPTQSTSIRLILHVINSVLLSCK